MGKDRSKRKADILAHNQAYEAEKARLESMTLDELKMERREWLKGVISSEVKSLKEDFDKALAPNKVKKLS